MLLPTTRSRELIRVAQTRRQGQIGTHRTWWTATFVNVIVTCGPAELSGWSSNIHNNIKRVIYYISTYLLLCSCTLQVGVRPVMCFTYGTHEEILEEHQDRLGVPTHGVALLADRDEVRKD